MSTPIHAAAAVQIAEESRCKSGFALRFLLLWNQGISTRDAAREYRGLWQQGLIPDEAFYFLITTCVQEIARQELAPEEYEECMKPGRFVEFMEALELPAPMIYVARMGLESEWEMTVLKFFHIGQVWCSQNAMLASAWGYGPVHELN